MPLFLQTLIDAVDFNNRLLRPLKSIEAWKEAEGECFSLAVGELSSAKNLHGTRAEGECFSLVCYPSKRRVVIIEDKKLLSVLFRDGCDGRAFTLKTETYGGPPFLEKALKFAVGLRFSMTNNKAQGQIIPHVGVYLLDSVSSHCN
ncbi:hypothetical protein QVD17_24495 [Tagetes erecta]|uniref:Uncharacterized protein n=1 Tax=Tagetes erecta TaxID=13708 RepID=A0AAD8NUW4_TARER|nr:hypothetical protein QVD17_24495 [Tagetes erecta]